MGSQLILLILHLVILLVGLLLLYMIPRCRGRLSEEDLGVLESLPLSVIIPARNEEDNLPRVLRSLAQQQPAPHEIFVIDDASTDNTATIAREAGARVVPAGPLPTGWTGKNHACNQGALHATGKLLLFMDADTWLETGALACILKTWLDGRGALSIGAFHHVHKLFESFSAFFNMVMTLSMNSFSIGSNPMHANGLFGPFLLLTFDDYQRCGGHAAVKEHILENMHLAKILQQHNIPARNYGGRDMLSIRMYPSNLLDLVNGWSKAFATGAGCTPPGLLLLIIAWLSAAASACVLLLLSLFSSSWSLPLWSLIYLLFATQTAWNLKRIGTFPLSTSIAYPIPLFFFFAVFTYASIAPNKTWKQRSVPSVKENDHAD